MPILGAIASSILKIITDNFNRTTSGGLGTSSSGAVWNGLRGVWFANGSQAQSNDSASTYPVASVSFRSNATVSADVSGGVGLSYWIADSNNYWASYPNYIQNSSTVTTCTGSTVSCTDTTNTCNPGGCGTVSSSSSTTCTGATVSCTDTTNTCNPGGCGSISSSGVTTYTCPDPGYPYLCPGATCNELDNCGGASIPATASGTTYTRTQNTNVTTYTRSQNTNVTTTIYTYDTQIKVISSVSGSIVTDSTTTLVSAASSLSPVGSLKVVTSGNQITTTAYSGTNLTSPLGSPIVRTPSSPNTGNSVGIIKAPSTYLQGSTLDTFSAS